MGCKNIITFSITGQNEPNLVCQEVLAILIISNKI